MVLFGGVNQHGARQAADSLGQYRYKYMCNLELLQSETIIFKVIQFKISKAKMAINGHNLWILDLEMATNPNNKD